jgi:hypothetical protein
MSAFSDTLPDILTMKTTKKPEDEMESLLQAFVF